MKSQKPVKIALVTYWFFPNTIIAARRAVSMYQIINRYPNMRLDVFTGSFNRDRAVRDRFPLDLSGVRYIRLHENRLEKAVFSRANAFGRLLNATVYRGRAEKRFGAALRRLRELQDYDVIYISLGPFSPLLRAAGDLRKRYPDKKLIIEYRDEWVEGAVHFAARNHLIHPYRRLRSQARKLFDYLSHRGGARLEKKVLPACDAIVVVAREMIPHFTARIPGLSLRKFHYIPNGISEMEIAGLEEWRKKSGTTRGTPLRLIYAGSLFGTQNITPLLEALDSLIGEGRIDRAEIELSVFGEADPLREKWPERLRRLVRYRGIIPRNDIYREYFTHDVILFIIGDWPKSEITMTGKIFELIESGRPILALLPLDKNGCARQLLEKTGAGLLAEIKDRERIKNAVLSLLEQKKKRGEIPASRRWMDGFHREHRYENTCRLLYENCFNLE